MKEEFFNRPSKIVARNILGKYLSHKGVVGKIVETEAYHEKDEASHSFNGLKNRNVPMFGKSGIAYIYFTYGMHYCFNVVTNSKGIGEAVLIRALEPIKGIDLMKKRRGTNDIKNLCNGPAKLTQALGISKDQNNSNLINGPIKILDSRESPKIIQTKRIGISKAKDLPLRFYIKDNPFVSKK